MIDNKESLGRKVCSEINKRIKADEEKNGPEENKPVSE